MIFFRPIKNQKGQAIIFTAIGMLVLSLGLIISLNIGNAVYEKVRLQNNADSAAYSLATMEARAFNYWAYTNRAQVTNYVAMMSVQSMMSMMLWWEMALGGARDMLLTIATPIDMDCHNGFLPGKNCPIAHNFHTVARNLENAATEIGQHINVIQTQKYLPQMWEMNKWAMYGSQYLMGKFIFQDMMDSEIQNFIFLNDNEIDIPLSMAITREMNRFEFLRAIDVVSGRPPAFSSLTPPPTTLPAHKTLKRVMTEMANATRHNKFLTNRDTTYTIPSFSNLVSGMKGQTKLVSSSAGHTGKSMNGLQTLLSSIAFDNTKLATGDELVADNIGRIDLGTLLPSIQGMPAILSGQIGIYLIANQSGGEMIRWKKHDFIDGIPFYHEPFSRKDDFEVVKGTGAFHFSGVAPFIKFAPNVNARDFNQPSTWFFLNKNPSKLNKIWTFNFKWHDIENTQSFDTRVGGSLPSPLRFLNGLNAISRGMVYYHRPGNWNEHPNFFNPFWHAKLAPVGPALKKILQQPAGVPGPFLQIAREISGLVLGDLITH